MLSITILHNGLDHDLGHDLDPISVVLRYRWLKDKRAGGMKLSKITTHQTDHGLL